MSPSSMMRGTSLNGRCTFILALVCCTSPVRGFQSPARLSNLSRTRQRLALGMVDAPDKLQKVQGNIESAGAPSIINVESEELKASLETKEEEGQAATGTVNERLLSELQQAAEKEKYGNRSGFSKKLGLDSFKSRKTDEERQAAIEEARNLNGVNPVVALAGSTFALGLAFGLWFATSWLAEFFAMHPVDTDLYFVERAAAVVRNLVMGLGALASGFFGVTGLGIFLLGVRVSYGVATGELDPTPIMKKKGESEDTVQFQEVWKFMTGSNKRRGQK